MPTKVMKRRSTMAPKKSQGIPLKVCRQQVKTLLQCQISLEEFIDVEYNMC